MSSELAQAILQTKAPETTESIETEKATESVAIDESTTEPKQETSDVAKRLGIIAKREKQMMEQKSAWESEKSEIMKRLESLEQEKNQYKSVADAIKNKEWGKIKEDLDYDDLSSYLLNGEQETIETRLEKRLRDMEGKFEEKLTEKEKQLQQKEQERWTYAQQQAVDAFKKNIGKELEVDFKSENPKYEWLSQEENATDLVYEIIEANFKATEESGRPVQLTWEEAAQMAEKYLEEQAEKRLQKVKKAKTLFEKLYGPKSEPTKNGQAPMASKTLTNSITPTTQENRTQKKELNWLDLERSKSEAAKLIRFK